MGPKSNMRRWGGLFGLAACLLLALYPAWRQDSRPDTSADSPEKTHEGRAAGQRERAGFRPVTNRSAVSTVANGSPVERIREAYRAPPPSPPSPGAVGPRLLRLAAVALDTAAAAPFVPGRSSLRQSETHRGTAAFLVQFAVPIRPAHHEALRARGATVRGFVPYNALLVEMRASDVSDLSGLSDIRWVGEFEPGFKIQPVLARVAADPAVADPGAPRLPVVVQTLSPDDTEPVAAAVARAGGTVESSAAGRRWGVVRASVPPSALDPLARLAAVQWIEARVPAELVNDIAVGSRMMNAAAAWAARGLSGSNQVVGHADTGLDVGSAGGLHPDFSGRIRAAFALARPGDWSDPQGHGTHTAGSILGSGAMSSNQFRGVAWGAQLVHQSVMDGGGSLSGLPADLNDLFGQAYAEAARIHSDSWGLPVYGQYTVDSQQCDEFMWDHPDMLVVAAAGNDGTDANSDGRVDADSIAAPGSAKNVLTVGAAESDREPWTGGYTYLSWGSGWPTRFTAAPISGDYLSKSADGMNQGLAAFSGRGPTDDGRVKPDLVAPGVNIVSTRSRKSGAGTGWGAHPNAGYCFNGGTSMATPLAAGAAALVREYFAERRGWTNPSAALVKATLLNGARSLAPGQYGTNAATREIPAGPRPNAVEGWGQVNLDATLFPAAPRGLLFVDNAAPLTTGATNLHVLHVSDAGALSVTLAWTDHPATPAAAQKLVNDLDLVVLGPDGVARRPGGGASADRTNNVETIEFEAPASGVYTALVEGASVPMGPQPYALVVHGAVQEPPVIRHDPPGNTHVTDAPYDVSARVFSPLTFATNTVRLYWNATGSTDAYEQVAMPLRSNDVFGAGIPAQPLGTRVRYYLAAGEGPMETRHPAVAPSSVHEYQVTEPVVLTVSGRPSDLFDVRPAYGASLVASGAVVRAVAPAHSNLAASTRAACVGWAGTGSAPAAGASNAVSFEIREPSSLTWLWAMQYALAQTGSVSGLLETQTWWNVLEQASTVAAPGSVASGTNDYRFCGWYAEGARLPNATDKASNPAGGLTMLQPRAVEARYLPATLDTDADGMADWWELYFFGSTSAVYNADSDDDGFTNLKEFLDGVDPRDAASVPLPPAIAHVPLANPQTSPPPWAVSAKVSDNAAVAAVTLWWNRNGGGWQSAPMARTPSPNQYEASIPAPGANGDLFEYRIEAADEAGLKGMSGPYETEPRYPVLQLAPAPPMPYRVPDATSSNVLVAVTNGGLAPLTWTLEPLVLFDDVESGTGAWTHAGIANAWKIHGGRWRSASNSWHFGNGPGGNYPDRANASLVSGPVRLDVPARLVFWHWASMEYDTDQQDDHYWDGGVVELSTNDGASFAMISPVGGYPHRITDNPVSPFPPDTPCYGGTSGQWERAEFDLSAWTGQVVRVRFRFGADYYTTDEGWYIDDIAIEPAAGRLDWLEVVDAAGANAPSEAREAAVRLDTRPLAIGETRSAVLRLAHNAPAGPPAAAWAVALHNKSRDIQVLAGPFGSVAPSGTIRVEADTSPVFTLTADAYCRVSDILTNGVSAGAVGGAVRQTNWAWPNVQSNGTLEVRFAQALSVGGVPEWWLGLYGLTNAPPDDEAVSDTDGDGMLAWQEWRLLTDPTNAASVALKLTDLRMDGVTVPGGVYTNRFGQERTQQIFQATGEILEWLSFTNLGYRYEVWSATNLGDAFAPMETNLPATPPVNLFTNPAVPVDLRFFDIRVREE